MEVINEMVKQHKSKSACRDQSRSPLKKLNRSKVCSPDHVGHKWSLERIKHRNRSKSRELDQHNTKNGKSDTAKNDNHINKKKRGRSRDLDQESRDRKRGRRSVENSASCNDRKKNRSCSRDRKMNAGDEKRRSKSCDKCIYHEVNHYKGRGQSSYQRDKGKRSQSRDRRKGSISRERSSDRKNTKKQKGMHVSQDEKNQRKILDRIRSRDHSASVDRDTDRKQKSKSQNRSVQIKNDYISRRISTSRSKCEAGESHTQNPIEQITISETVNPSSTKESQSRSKDVDIPRSNQSITPSVDNVKQQSGHRNQVSLQIESKYSLNQDLERYQSMGKDQSNSHGKDKCKIVTKKSYRNYRNNRSKSPTKDSQQQDRKRRSKSTHSPSHHRTLKRKSRSKSPTKDSQQRDSKRRSKSTNSRSHHSILKRKSRSRSRNKDSSKNDKRRQSKSKYGDVRQSDRKSRSKSRSRHRQSDRKSRSKSRSRHKGNIIEKVNSKDQEDYSKKTPRSESKDAKGHNTNRKSLDKDRGSHRTVERFRSKSPDRSRCNVWKKRSRSREVHFDKRKLFKIARNNALSSIKQSAVPPNRKSLDRDKGSHRTVERIQSKSPDRSRCNVRKKRRRSREVNSDERKLFKIAGNSALSLTEQSAVPSCTENIVTIKAGGKSVQVTEFCKQISKEEARASSDADGKKMHHNGSVKERPFRHRFQLKERPTKIVFNIKNFVSVSTKALQEKTVKQSKQLQLQFPVSSGQNHRKTESEWVPGASSQPSSSASQPSEPVGRTLIQPISTAISTSVFSTVLAAVQTDLQSTSSAFPPAPVRPPDIGEKRLYAMRELNVNPNDSDAMSQIYLVNQQTSVWLASKQQPGQFTGSTGVKVVTAPQLSTGYQTWTKNDQLTTAAPVGGGMGMALLQKMGWRPGEGLGKNKKGSLEPVTLQIKVDKKGLIAQEEIRKKRRRSRKLNKKKTTLSGKHPVSLLVEFCSKRHWDPPQFHVCLESGPDHKKKFLFKVCVNGTEYQPIVASTNKKEAKVEAARLCLHTLGLLYPDMPKRKRQ